MAQRSSDVRWQTPNVSREPAVTDCGLRIASSAARGRSRGQRTCVAPGVGEPLSVNHSIGWAGATVPKRVYCFDHHVAHHVASDAPRGGHLAHRLAIAANRRSRRHPNTNAIHRSALSFCVMRTKHPMMGPMPGRAEHRLGRVRQPVRQVNDVAVGIACGS
jgi:hypothetical protein